MRSILYICLFLHLFLFSFESSGAGIDSIEINSGDSTLIVPASYVMVDAILIYGNKKTKPHIIIRELTFKEGDILDIDALSAEMEQSRKNLINTQLFNEVTFNIKNWKDNHLEILIEVQERWYSIPIPMLRLADRNFNVWWQEQGRDFGRIIYGLTFQQNNFRGRDEILRLHANLGYSQDFQIYYEVPYATKGQRLGWITSFKFGRNKEVASITNEDKPVFYDRGRFIRDYYQPSFGITYRRKIFSIHQLDLIYNHVRIDDSLKVRNPQYLRDGGNKQKHFTISYLYERDTRDNKAYAHTGYFMTFLFEKHGLGIFDQVNHWIFRSTYSQFWDLGKKFLIATDVRFKVSFPAEQPYYDQLSLGFEKDLVRGYELYVMDGQHYWLGKLNFKYQLFSFNIDYSRIFKWSKFNKQPWNIYLKIYSDLGYVKNDYFNGDNELTNDLLLGWGAGVDLVTYYSTTFRIEYSFNRMLENGIFLHFITDL